MQAANRPDLCNKKGQDEVRSCSVSGQRPFLARIVPSQGENLEPCHSCLAGGTIRRRVTMRYLNLSLVILFVGVFVITGCSSLNRTLMARTLFVDDHPELSEMQADAILNGQIMVGMTHEMVTAAWGKPSRIETIEANDASKQWIYGNYFVGGTITNLFFGFEGQLIRYEVNYEPTHANGGSIAGADGSAGSVLLSGNSGLLSKDGTTSP